MNLVRFLRTRLGNDDGGFSLAWLATILVLLLGMAGFATDLGWMYLNTVKTQNAADAGALAGVPHLPGFVAQAQSDASDAVRANGYDPGGADTLIVTALPDNQLHVELSTSIEPFFMRVFGFDRFDITREATAQYVEPVRLGNPNNCFGCPSIGSSWAAVSSPYISKEYGDPFSTNCLVTSGTSSCDSGNPDYARGPGGYVGYYYGIAVEAGSSGLTVELYDAEHNTRFVQFETGDFDLGSGSGVTTHYQLYAVDDTPYDPTDNTPISGCSLDLPPNNGTYMNSWDTLCTVPGALTEGFYVLHVWSSGTGIGSNHYSVRANVAAGPTPRVFGLNDMSIWSNNLTTNTELYLAEIEAIHAGKIMELSFFDAGDAGSPSRMKVVNPFGSGVTCDYEVWNHSQTSLIDSMNSVPCEWDTSSQAYNNQWIVVRIDLPDDPAMMCNGSDCFWKMELDLSQPTERTTWRARVIGSPVRLIP